MGTYDFDTVWDRRGTDCIKWDQAKERGHKPDELPLWVADMDFQSPPEVIEALHKRVDHGIFGYTDPGESYTYALIAWFGYHYEWIPDKSWCIDVPGVVYGLAQAIKAFTNPGDAVIIQRPVYYPFTSVIETNNRAVANSPLVYDPKTSTYSIDFDDFERTIEKYDAKLFLLCNPHNPGCRAWTKDELRRLGDICVRHNVVVVSDEIHADFVWKPYKHASFASLSEEFANISVTCTSASKSFNLAGLQVATAIIPNEELRAKFSVASEASGYSQANIMGLVAAEAAYTKGQLWLDEVKEYIQGNLEVVKSYLEQTPALKLVEFQATYLPWIDCMGLGLTNEELTKLITHDAKLWLDMGNIFGREGEGFIRLNIATPRSIVEDAMQRLTNAVKGLESE